MAEDFDPSIPTRVTPAAKIERVYPLDEPIATVVSPASVAAVAVLEVVPKVVPEPVVVVPVAPVVVAPVELRYEYQPTDEHGRALGGKQVIKYTKPEELADKLRDQNISLVRQMRKINKDHRLGKATTPETLPEGVDKVEGSEFAVPVFEKKTLTVEERFQLSQDLNDPEKFEAARDKLLDSGGFGAIKTAITKQQREINEGKARMNCEIFMEKTPGFYRCTENLETVTDWLLKNRLQPTVNNFEIANSVMKEAGLLLESPIVREEVPPVVAVVPAPVPPTPALVEPMVPITQAPVAEAARISEPTQPQKTVRSLPQVSSGLNSRTASNTGVELEDHTLTMSDIDRMSGDEYKRRLQTDPKFVAAVDRLEEEKIARSPRPR
jgi:hypothetical protein